MKIFGQYFTFFMTEMGASADAANELALRQVATVFEEMAVDMSKKADYVPEV